MKRITTMIASLAIAFASQSALADEYADGQVAQAIALAKLEGMAAVVDQSVNHQKVQAPDQGDIAPVVYAPNLTAGMNECALSTSGGAAIGGTNGIPGIGASFGTVYESDQCRAENAYKLAANSVEVKTDANGELTESAKAGQMFVKFTACQLIPLWTSYEMMAQETGDSSHGCPNPKPEGGFVELRPRNERGQHIERVAQIEAPEVLIEEQYASADDSGYQWHDDY